MGTALASGMFCATYIILLYFNFHSPKPAAPTGTETFVNSQGVPIYSSDPSYRQPATDSFNVLPTDDPEFLRQKRELAGDKTDETLTAAVREKDRALRSEFFRRREFVAQTIPWLVLASVVFLISVTTASVLRRKLPIPKPENAVEARRSEQFRLFQAVTALVALACLLVGLGLGLFLMPDNQFEPLLVARIVQAASESTSQAAPVGETPAVTGAAAEESEDQPSPETPMDRDAFLVELAAAWPAFRGFDGSGVVHGPVDKAAMPIHWDATKGENVLWQTEIPLPGKSSPIVWGNRLFVTGADETQRKIFCFNTEDGKLLWATDAPSTPESQGTVKTSEDTGYAAPTMVTDGRRAFAMFANGDIVAVDFNGKVLWSKSLGIPETSYGFSSSPSLYFDRFIVQYDVGDGSDGKSKLYAFDVKTGRTLWETPREIANSWSSPMVRKFGDRFQVVTCGDPYVISYDPEDGKEIWRCRCLAGDVGPSPAAAGNVVIITNQGPRTTAIDATGSGDVTETHVLWQGVNALPDTPSPFASEKRTYTLDSHGFMTSYDPAKVNDRKRAAYWELELGEGMASFYSSPILAGDLTYVFDMTEDEPKAFVIDLSHEKTDDSGVLDETAADAMRVAANPMPEPCVATPAVVGNRIYIRGTKTLFCIGGKP